MNSIQGNTELIAYCGLYCAECGSYKKGSCPGCHKNLKASWCKIHTCNIEHNYKSCADCSSFNNPMECKMYNNIFSKVIGFVLRSNRSAGITLIKERGYENFAAYMTENKLQSMKR